MLEVFGEPARAVGPVRVDALDLGRHLDEPRELGAMVRVEAVEDVIDERRHGPLGHVLRGLGTRDGRGELRAHRRGVEPARGAGRIE